MTNRRRRSSSVFLSGCFSFKLISLRTRVSACCGCCFWRHKPQILTTVHQGWQSSELDHLPSHTVLPHNSPSLQMICRTKSHASPLGSPTTLGTHQNNCWIV
ncbi:hypothetical protein KC19_6G012700 [Ceratodon purpureus]|uniref:Uncharacterized protein n=1 Tax=Ceratodon purpureus TaxID=3225 RepID=A0A8T0HA84_CERPU|nr:hypothetical protein KC19_6G012700 [Ceratodon purpureus]